MNTIKKLLCAALALLLLGAPALAEELPAFGVCIYDGTDTFMASLRLHLETYAHGKARLTVYDSRNDQNLQIPVFCLSVFCLIAPAASALLPEYLFQCWA